MTFNRTIAATLACALTLTSVNFTAAQAGSAKPQVQAANAAAATTDFSARRYRRGNAAALGAMIGIFGTIAAIAAAEQRRDYYGRYGYGAPYYGPYGYGAPYAYAPAPVYRYRYRY